MGWCAEGIGRPPLNPAGFFRIRANLPRTFSASVIDVLHPVTPHRGRPPRGARGANRRSRNKHPPPWLRGYRHARAVNAWPGSAERASSISCRPALTGACAWRSERSCRRGTLRGRPTSKGRDRGEPASKTGEQLKSASGASDPARSATAEGNRKNIFLRGVGLRGENVGRASRYGRTLRDGLIVTLVCRPLDPQETQTGSGFPIGAGPLHSSVTRNYWFGCGFGGVFGFLALPVAPRPLAGEHDSALAFAALELRAGDVARVHGRQPERDALGPCELEAVADGAGGPSPRIVSDVGNDFLGIEVEPALMPAVLSKSQHFGATMSAAIVRAKFLAIVTRVAAGDLGVPGCAVRTLGALHVCSCSVMDRRLLTTISRGRDVASRPRHARHLPYDLCLISAWLAATQSSSNETKACLSPSRLSRSTSGSGTSMSGRSKSSAES
jgi:hypothetical protein